VRAGIDSILCEAFSTMTPGSLRTKLPLALLLLTLTPLLFAQTTAPAKLNKASVPELKDPEAQVPDERVMLPFKDRRPIHFVVGSPFMPEWDKLPGFWNETTEKTTDPYTGKEVVRKAVAIKVPLGLTTAPPVPAENPLTVEKFLLGRDLYFDKIISSDGTASCASCHDPKTGFTTNTRFSTGIFNKVGGMNAPTVLNSAYNLRQFWDGRAASLEEQAQGPPGNALEMFDGDGEAWHKVVLRCRNQPLYQKRFQEVFGTEPTRDAVAMAIAAYERLVLVGNAIHDRADIAMKKRIIEEESFKMEVLPKDYETVLKEAVARKDKNALDALHIDPARDGGKLAEIAARINNGRLLFSNKARCNGCHVGDSFSDQNFHNLGVGVVNGKLPPEKAGRYGALPTGHKHPAMLGAFKTPPLRGLIGSQPYMHDGSEDTLEKVVEFYDRGGNANEFLDVRMRDVDNERAWLRSKETKEPYKGPEPKVFTRDGRPIIPLALKLTDQEKKDLVLFLRALQSDPPDAMVADPKKMP